MVNHHIWDYTKKINTQILIPLITKENLMILKVSQKHESLSMGEHILWLIISESIETNNHEFQTCKCIST